MAMNWFTGFHAVEEALAAGRALDRIVIARGRHGERSSSGADGKGQRRAGAVRGPAAD